MAGPVVGAKELGFQLAFRTFVAPYRNQRCRRPGTGLMNTMSQALFARTRFPLEQQIVVAPGNPGSLVLQRQEFVGIAHHAVQAVAGAVAGSMGNGGFQIFNGHGDDDDTFHPAGKLHRQDAGHIFVGPVLGNPGNFLADGALAP